MMADDYIYEPIDLCACYEPIVKPPADFFAEPEPTLENTSYYAVEPDGTEYFYCGNTRIKVSEHFATNGKTISHLMENVIQYAARKASA